ncbi:hypothetical protein [Robbsia andropogonis]|uniref:hypothetical protein n=1 Tax=Robbsia andropogonis TaxID=28092 RepID=UPI0020A15FB6|nr:hypothetical protein [Robbsia andropogonis]MCP1131285.1 hypothetical protein [Robbsia andropogonis]
MTEMQVNEAFARAVHGESVRSLAREYGVDESSLRERFKRCGATPAEVRRLAFDLFYARQQVAMLDEAERREVERLMRAGWSRRRDAPHKRPLASLLTWVVNPNDR